MIQSSLSSFLGKLSFDSKTRERCWKKLGRQLKVTHLPLEHCFRMLYERAKAEKNPVHIVYGHIIRSLESGHKIGKALTGFAAPEEIMLIDSGQTGGEFALADGFLRAAELMEKRRKIKGMLIKELAYPVLLFCGVIGFLVVISTVLMPQLTVLSNPETWHGPASVLYHLSDFIASWYGVGVAFFILFIIIVICYSMKNWCGFGRNFADKMPPWSIYRILSGVSWLYATAILLQTKELKLETIIRNTISGKAASPYLRSRLRPIYNHTIKGLNLGEALCAAGRHWPDASLADDLRTYAALPGFNQQLGSIADDMLMESMERIQRGASVLGVLSILFLVGTIVLLVSGIFSIQQQLTQGLGA